MARKKKQANDLKEGEYPSAVMTQYHDGEKRRIPVVKSVPANERPTLPIKDALLSEFLLPTFDSMNIRGKSGLDALILLCRMGAHRYESLKRFCIAWEDLHQPNLFAEIYPELEFKEPTLEQCCDLAKLESEEFIGDISRMIYHYGLEAAKWQIHLGLGDVIRESHKVATTEGVKGFNDRRLLMEAGRLMPEGPDTVVNVNNQVTTNQIVGLPKWEDTDKILVEALRPQKALAAASVVDLEPIEVETEKEKQNAT